MLISFSDCKISANDAHNKMKCLVLHFLCLGNNLSASDDCVLSIKKPTLSNLFAHMRQIEVFL